MTELRQYQLGVADRIAALRATGTKRVLLVAPTGSGKTLMAAELIRREIEREGRVLFLAHRRELVTQASEKLYGLAKIDTGIILAGYPARPGEPVQIGSVQTFHARAIRGTALERPEATLVLVDEAHHVRARSYQDIIKAYPDAFVVGLTATPCRGDGRGLGNAFEVMVEAPPVAALIAAGYLVPTRVFAPTRPDLSAVAVARGDYVESQLEKAMDKPDLVGDVVEHWHRLAQRRRTVIFASGVAHSVHLRDEFRRTGVLAEHIDGSTPVGERDAILARLASGTVEVVVNCMVLTEGWDQPEVSCVCIARPTKSMALYRQMVGRVLRAAPGKSDAIVIDHADVTREHGFVEEAVTWTLREDRRAENPRHSARAEGRAPALVQCPECHAVKHAGKPCGVCGWQPRPKAAPIEFADGVLAEFARNRRHKPDGPNKREFYAQLLWIAAEKQFKPGWAAHKFKEKFGDWPSFRHADPLPPSDATRSWVRSRIIAYAKARQKMRAAS
jgi:DNA repair protein RadD